MSCGRVPLGRGVRGEVAAQLGQQPARGPPRVVAPRLQDDAGAGPPVLVGVSGVLAQHRDLTGGPDPEALEDLDGRGLARAVRPEQADDLAARRCRSRPQSARRCPRSASAGRGPSPPRSTGWHLPSCGCRTLSRVGPPNLPTPVPRGGHRSRSAVGAWRNDSTAATRRLTPVSGIESFVKIALTCFSTVDDDRNSASSIRGVRLAQRHLAQHVELARGERRQRVRLVATASPHEGVDDHRVDDGPSGAHLDERVHEVLEVPDPVLEQVAQPGRAVLEERQRVGLVGVLRQDDDADARGARPGSRAPPRCPPSGASAASGCR